MRVACMGDSITRGNASHEPGRGTHRPYKEQTARRGSYPLDLQQLLGSDYIVRNFGHGGRSVVGRFAYNLTAEYRAAAEFAPHVVILMLGTNDAKFCPLPSTPEGPVPCKKTGLLPPNGIWDARAFAPTLEQLARRIRRLPTCPSMLLLAPPPVLPSAFKASAISASILSDEVSPRVEDVARRLSKEHPCGSSTVGFLSLQRAWTGCPESSKACGRFIGPDGVHTTEEGTLALARAIAPRLLQQWPERVAPGRAMRRRRQRRMTMSHRTHNGT